MQVTSWGIKRREKKSKGLQLALLYYNFSPIWIAAAAIGATLKVANPLSSTTIFHHHMALMQKEHYNKFLLPYLFVV